MNWNDYFFDMAKHVATKSKDTTRVGCVIVGPDKEIRSTGWNGFARGVRDDLPERMTRPEKYDWTVHAESNAICNAARSGVSLKYCTAYLTHFPCSVCTGLLIQAGIECVAVDSGQTVGDFKNDISMQQLIEANVLVGYRGKEEIIYGPQPVTYQMIGVEGELKMKGIQG